MSRTLSVAHLTAIDLAPPAFIEAAAEAGFDAVGLRLLRVTEDSPGYPLMEDPAAMRATRAALRTFGLYVSDVEFVRLTPETEIAPLLPLLDAGAELGARHVITAPYDPDPARLADTLGALHEAAAARGLGAVLEFFTWTPVPDLATCRSVVEQAGPDVGMLVDSLHFDRSGSTLAQLAEVPPHRLPFAHLCDARVHPPYTTEQLLETARAERLPPGEGEIDLAGVLEALPPDTPLGLEVPMAGLAAREGPAAVLARVAQAARRLTGDG
ncbi:sugar phosphate isomerase/epimerase family protein [Salipiger mucosus]|uniref:Sugar phosphate isomerase/epimerase n=1 Tax=Salipiger mucosus DSM 16094 TaxID=1123237 RepID=S9Q3A6_9RHOB|nr:sugar phosphate isomerase/epimerase [Salipiger mucosus]EPX75821.1 Sugar phosphate isomerase/epimerase [Salipiger mucosus DSM 16094]